MRWVFHLRTVRGGDIEQPYTPFVLVTPLVCCSTVGVSRAKAQHEKRGADLVVRKWAPRPDSEACPSSQQPCMGAGDANGDEQTLPCAFTTNLSCEPVCRHQLVALRGDEPYRRETDRHSPPYMEVVMVGTRPSFA